MIKQGIADAKAAVKKGEGVSARKALKEAYDTVMGEMNEQQKPSVEAFGDLYVNE